MAKDYKKRAPAKKSAAKRGMPGWAWMVVGLAIGLFAGFLFYLSERPAPAPAAITLPAPPKSAHHSAAPAKKQAAPTAKKSAEPAKPKFDFYTLLPELEVVVPKGSYTVSKPGQKNVAPSTPSAPPAPIETPGTYMLQAGSFRTYGQADRMKASLALLGVRAEIQQVKVNTDTWNRVQIGPFSSLKKLNAVRNDLQKHQIDTLVLKVKG